MAKKRKFGSKLKEAAKWAPLLPMKPFMQLALKRKKVKPKSRKIQDVAEAFYLTFINKKKVKTQPRTNFEAAMQDVHAHQEHIVGVSADIIIGAIKELITRIKDKKRKGLPLTKEESMVDQTLTDAEKGAKKSAIADNVVPIILITAVAGIGLFAILKK